MMRPFSLSEIAEVCQGRLVGQDKIVESISTDSRKVAHNTLFIALIGDRFDAHAFIADFNEERPAAVLVSRECATDLPQIIVQDTEKALGDLGAFNRTLFSGPVVAITGSGGKTSVKEMLAGALRHRFLVRNEQAGDPVLATRGNLNNQIGAPLTLLELNPSHRVAVIELGASGMGEIAYTVNLTQPNISILNNALAAHVEGFGSLQNIVFAKSEIYDGLSDGGVAVVNIDDPNAQYWLDKVNRLGHRLIRFGIGPEADLRAAQLVLQPDGTYQFQLESEKESVEIKLSVMGRHMVSNALAVASAWKALGYSLAELKPGIETYTGFKGRLQTHRLASGALLIDDSYNANPGSMRAALSVLASLPGPRVAVLGDMAELGETEIVEHQSLGEEAGKAGLAQLLTSGVLSEHTTQSAKALGVAAHHFSTFDDLLTEVLGTDLTSGAILIKGSRSAGLDRLVDALLERDD